MKKALLLFFGVMLNLLITHAQVGYSWSFGAAPPFISSPAIVGSPGTYTLTTLGVGDAGIAVDPGETVGIGTSCAAPISVGRYSAPPDFFPFGLEFTNNPQIVTNVYTIEITFKFSPTGGFHRLMGFNDLGVAPDNDYGIYIDGGGDVVFYSAAIIPTFPGGFYIGGTSLVPDTWYHLSFVRGANGFVRYYQDGVFQAEYNDAAGEFMPQAASANVINFLKDDGVEEVDGSIAKLSIFNRVLTESEILNRTLNNACNTTLQLPLLPTEGYQWSFAAGPLTSTPAVAGSTGSFVLTNVAAAATLGTPVTPALGTSCTGPIPAAAYPANSGFEMGNVPRYVYDTYSIEMVVNISDIGGVGGDEYRRLVAFNDLGDPVLGDNGIYVNPDGEIELADSPTTAFIIVGSPLAANTWYHLLFTRNAAGLISYYQNGVLVGTYNDAAGEFVPKAPIGNTITVLKDDDGDEVAGELAKLAIFNFPLAAADVTERFNSICSASLVVLPVSLKTFTAIKVEKEVRLSWTTASEENNLGFEVQRSTDGVNYTTIGFVKGSGTTTQETSYTFTDISPLTGKNYYRLKQVDITNLAVFSSVRRIDMDQLIQGLQLFPNPTRDMITITNIKAGDRVSIFNLQGRLIHRQVAGSGQESLSVARLASGVYILQVTDAENNKRMIRFNKL
jgi:hypothetical protein